MDIQPCLKDSCRNLSTIITPTDGPSLLVNFLTIIFGSVAGIAPNVIIIIGIYRDRSMQKPTYYFMANLAICDVVLSVATLSNMMLIAIEFRVGLPVSVYNVLCKILAIFLTCWSYTASMQTLIIISAERYQAIHKPTKKLTAKRARHLCFVSWSVAFLLSFPFLITSTIVQRDRKYCFPYPAYTSWAGIMNSVLFVFQYILPAVFMMTSYSLILCQLRKNRITPHQESTMSKMLKRKTVYMLLTTTIIFLALSAPWALSLFVVVVMGELPFDLEEDPTNPIIQSIIRSSKYVLPYTTLYNPIVYCIFNPKIQQLYFSRCERLIPRHQTIVASRNQTT